MGKSLKQFRYYEEDSTLNAPIDSANPKKTINKNNLTSGSIFWNSNNLVSIASLGIQTIPGVKFYLNNSVDPIIIGSTGIYELSLSDGYEVNALRFDSTSINLINDSSNNAYLIIDIVYNTEE